MREQPPVDRALTDAYGELAVWQAERIFGLGDREAESETYGCFDRNYWHYRCTDTPNARAQEIALYLAMLHLLEEEFNPFAGKAPVRDWAVAAIEFWMVIQNRDGTLDEFHPYERSFAATAYSTWAIVEASALLQIEPPEENITRACSWLTKNDTPQASNETAAAIMTLDAVGRTLDNRRFVNAGREKLVNLLQSQDDEGGFPELGGFDLGSQTLTLGFLTLYVRRTRDEQAYDSIQRGVKRVDKSIRPDGTFHVPTMTRRTQFLYPLALVLLEQDDLVRRHLGAVGGRRAPNPAWLDDRHCHQLAANYLQTAYEVFRACS